MTGKMISYYYIMYSIDSFLLGDIKNIYWLNIHETNIYCVNECNKLNAQCIAVSVYIEASGVRLLQLLPSLRKTDIPL